MSQQRYNEDLTYYDVNGQRLSCEAYTHAVTQTMGRRERQYIVRLLGWCRDDLTLSHRLFTEYCPNKTLDDLIKVRYHENLLNVSTITMEPLPEPFLYVHTPAPCLHSFQTKPIANSWCVFETLASAAEDMRDPPSLDAIGRPTGNSGGNDGTEIIHQDLKPSNIFLGNPVPTFFPTYPELKVADFGSGRLTRDGEQGNPDYPLLVDAHTSGFIPPELQVEETDHGPDQIRPADSPRIPILYYTNIWQIGMIMRQLLCLETEDELITLSNSDYLDCAYQPRLFAGQPNDTWVPQMQNMLEARPGVPYSQELVDLVKECLAVDVYQRPHPRILLSVIRARMRDYIGDMATRTDVPRNDPHKFGKGLSLDLKYREGLSAWSFGTWAPGGEQE